MTLCPSCKQEIIIRQLSPRVKEVLGLLVQGLSNEAIGKELSIKARTVKAHIAKAICYYNVKNRVALAVCMYKELLDEEKRQHSSTNEPGISYTDGPS